MTREQREWHERMNAAILTAVTDDLWAQFDIDSRDFDAEMRTELQLIRSNLKTVTLKAYARQHPWINEG